MALSQAVGRITRALATLVLAATSTSVAEGSMAACTNVVFLNPPSTFPIRITKPGCYALKGTNWTVPNADTTGIKITASNVFLNLNDRELKGPVTCPLGANGPACSATGLGVGIDASTAKNVSIFNGHVHGFGAQGIRAGRAGRIEDLDAFENGLAGIAANDLAELSHVRSEQNGGNGFTGGDGVSVSESHFNDNGKKGMQVQSDGTLIRIKSLRNLEEGIRATDNLSVTDGHVNGNKLRGVLVGVGAQLSGVIARNNVLDGFKVGDDALLDRLTATGNGGDGINAGNKSKIRNSLSSDNAENGVFAETASNIEDCIASHNKKGLVLSGGGGRVSGNTVKESVEKGMELSLTTLFQNNALADNPQHRTGGVNAGSNVCDTALCP